MHAHIINEPPGSAERSARKRASTGGLFLLGGLILLNLLQPLHILHLALRLVRLAIRLLVRCNVRDNVALLRLLWVATDFSALPVAAVEFTLVLIIVRCHDIRRELVRDVTLALLMFSLLASLERFQVQGETVPRDRRAPPLRPAPTSPHAAHRARSLALASSTPRDRPPPVPW